MAPFGWTLSPTATDASVMHQLQDALRQLDHVDFRTYLTGKYLVSLFGPTSAGKSAFANELIGAYVRESQQGKVDTQFTIIETVDKKEFQKFAPPAEYKSITKPSRWPDVRPKRLRAGADADRYGSLYIQPEPQQCRTRYEQSDIISGEVGQKIMKTHSLNCVLVNEEHLPKDSLARKLIIVDTRGVEATDSPTDASSSEARELYAHFFQRADMSFVMFPARITKEHKMPLQFLEECRANSLGQTIHGDSSELSWVAKVFRQGLGGRQHLESMWSNVTFMLTQVDTDKGNEKALGVNIGKLLGKAEFDVNAAHVKFVAMPYEQDPGNARLFDLTAVRNEVQLEAEEFRIPQPQQRQHMCSLAEQVIEAAEKSQHHDIWYQNFRRSSIFYADDVRIERCGKISRRVAGDRIFPAFQSFQYKRSE